MSYIPATDENNTLRILPQIETTSDETIETLQNKMTQIETFQTYQIQQNSHICEFI